MIHLQDFDNETSNTSLLAYYDLLTVVPRVALNISPSSLPGYYMYIILITGSFYYARSI